MAAVMPAATGRQAEPVARREPAPGRWVFSPGLPSLTSSLTAVLARDAICARAGLHVGCCGRAPFFIPCILHFFASCIPATAAFQHVNDMSVFSFHEVCIPCSMHHARSLHPLQYAHCIPTLCIPATVAFQKAKTTFCTPCIPLGISQKLHSASGLAHCCSWLCRNFASLPRIGVVNKLSRCCPF